ncbi:MAG: DUF58 domain-containing protein, partial [Oceanicaulis sp.]|nr:DUF58 domain-containing protein [Oceanicaulis sp.]
RVSALGETGRARGGRTGVEIAARALADGPGAVSSVEAPDIQRHARLVLASDFLDPPETWARRLSALAGTGARGVMLRVIDPAEDSFPFQGRTRFEPAGGGQALVFGKAESARAGYARLWTEHGEALRDIARRAGWRLISHRTDRPAGTAVMALYQALDPDRS